MNMKKQIGIIGVLVMVSFLPLTKVHAGWQQTLESRFAIVETFDELQDWTPGGQFYSMAGCETCASNLTLPKKNDGSNSIWTFWNNKGISFQYTPGNGTFVRGDVITGSTSGATETIERVWVLEGKSYIQITSTDGTNKISDFVVGENITSGSKTGTNLQWPLFIADHGPSHTWRGTGKSLMMDLGDNNANDLNPSMEGIGAQRMGLYFGDGISGKSGFKKAHVFFMVKLNPEFFSPCVNPGTQCLVDGYDTVSVIKMFDLNSGFTDITTWGNSADRALVDPNHANYPRLDEYGLNFSVFNLYGGGSTFPESTFFIQAGHVANPSGAPSLYTYLQTISNVRMRNGTSMDVDGFSENNQWFGVEMAQDIGTVNTTDGTTEFWIYDQDGILKGYYVATGENHLKVFDHYYNKFVFGGNRLSAHDGTGGLDARWWVDDLIISGTQIGPTYFSTLASFQGPADVTAPAAPSGLSVI
ncbi:MAG: hypothetical protein UY19_C0010G0047 [Candidatus Wolfebacteria bacterium GW2011_GWA2_47_9b]|uniref:Uncharacterized protein n=2 Tax=Candidatus Wolfeibacteriota TaxID=1752735 RepID=A0A0G1U6K8_9BACT|nr:MAG: hypothetical protein UX83_C0008G0060 [Candidatus Wolfebacteria bacterium GW2011_GWE2_47_12]KKU65685.1 MAG: hypothetical protein UX90_C0002G0061 [Candidatus Wolfebacteria bacterium GW2011_GWD2_47_17]KKU89714.1 MAG: hypothetical protein UY19_C0010G0047 [Candidatus Wolfebacteria bacterium GW2011_GWA2_47_9b]HBD18158.1 hypothetical protein [Candidatus Wolfebacteria bacterium]